MLAANKEVFGFRAILGGVNKKKLLFLVITTYPSVRVA
jgi:hypothetical protein